MRATSSLAQSPNGGRRRARVFMVRHVLHISLVFCSFFYLSLLIVSLLILKRSVGHWGFNNTPFGLSITSATLPKTANAHAVPVWAGSLRFVAHMFFDCLVQWCVPKNCWLSFQKSNSMCKSSEFFLILHPFATEKCKIYHILCDFHSSRPRNRRILCNFAIGFRFVRFPNWHRG